jgi:AAA+ ATPase superfamily predicted ATPase
MKWKGFLSVRDRVMLHLAGYPDMDDLYEVPQVLGQAGIANTINARQNMVSYALKALKDEGYVLEKTAHFKGIKSKKKAYFPTEGGLIFARSIEKEMENHLIKVKDYDGKVKEMKLSKLKSHLEKPLSSLELALMIPAKGVFDCEVTPPMFSERERDKAKKFVYFSEKASTPKYFFGREKELDCLNKWLASPENKIIVIHGIPGIGKTTLASNLMSRYKGKRNLFWYQFHQWDILRNLVNQLAEFFSTLGAHRLHSYLSRTKSLDINNLSDLAEEDLKDTNVILFFDDFHRAEELTVQFFSSLTERMERMDSVKMVVIGRYIHPFYQRKAVVVNRMVSELQLNGLDEDSSSELLRAKGITEPQIKKIYELTKGHPLSMELIESTEHVTDGRNIKKYIHEEIFSELTSEEKKLLMAFAVFRYPVKSEAFFVEDDITHECLDSLLDRSLVNETQHEMYDIHELIREFFYNRLTPRQKKRYHKAAAGYYLSQADFVEPGKTRTTAPHTSLQNQVEALYHLLMAGEHENTAGLAEELGAELINHGHLEELNMSNGLAESFYGLGLMFKEKGDKKSAEKFFKKAHKIFEKLENKSYLDRIESELKEL